MRSGRTARAGGNGTVTSIVTKYDAGLARQIQQDLANGREMRPKARTSSPYNTRVALKKRAFRGGSEKLAAPRAAASTNSSSLPRDAGQMRKKKAKKSGVMKVRRAGPARNRYENL